ncbi:MAG TPA: RNA polymerase sigma factor [Ktedonobacterales bacterium]|jgi:RNA polymerase sigma-70 factor (ECF subfamily)
MTAKLDESPATLLYKRHARPVLAYLRLHAPSWEDAEDVLQEVFLATLDHRHLLSLPEREQLAWFVAVARHKLADHYRQRHRRPALPLEPLTDEIEEEAALAPEQVLLGQEAQNELWEAVKQLSGLQQQVVYFRFVGGLRCPQIAVLLNKREDAVRKLLSRALNQLRHHFNAR